MTLSWTIVTFGDLSAAAVYEILSLRQQVFVVEQHSIFLDADGTDGDAWHVQGRNERGELIAYLRILGPGTRFADPSIGRVVVRREYRGTGLGKLLMREGLTQARRLFPGRAIRISAQTTLMKFYRDLGFRDTGIPYDDGGIEHCDMVRDP